MLTAVSLCCAIAAGVLFWQQMVIWGIVLVILTAITDMLDGATARAGNTDSVFGGILDHVIDRYAEFCILAGLGVSGMVPPIWAMYAIFGMLIASYTRAAAESIGKLSTCAVGIMGRMEKFVVIIAGVLLETFVPGYNLLMWALIIVGTTSIFTSIQRLVFTRNQLRGESDS